MSYEKMRNMAKKHKTMSIPRQYYEEIEGFYDKFKDVCEDLQISSPSELLRSLARLGKPRFLEIVEQVRKGRTQRLEEPQEEKQ